MILRELLNLVEAKYPKFLAESWDNVGLMIGDYEHNVHRILVALEANEAVIEEAIDKKVDLIITHHPFFFSKFNQINSDTLKGRLTLRLIQNGIALYSMHTNYDIAFDGMNDQFMKRMGWHSDEIFLPAKTEDWYIEQNSGKIPGLGRITTLTSEITLAGLCQYMKEQLDMEQIRVVGDTNTNIRKVAVITGAAADYFEAAKSAGADVLISGDMKYHIAQDALDSGMVVIDCGHFETENIFKDAMKDFLSSVCSLDIISSTVNLNPFQYV